MNSIPIPFSAVTTSHDELIHYRLCPAAQKIYNWLLRRVKPGTQQEFDQADYDAYCREVNHRPFSKYWFTKCINAIASTRLLKIERRYRGGGYQVRVYHPWQLDDWVVENDFTNKSCKNSNESFKNSNKSFKKQPPNPDSVVPSYKEIKEKQNNLETSSNVLISMGKKVAASFSSSSKSAPPTASFTRPVDGARKCDFSQDKEKSGNFDCGLAFGEQRSERELNDLKPALNKAIDNQQNHVVKDNLPRPVEVKVNKNKKWESHLDQLDDLGIKENQTIKDAVRSHSTQEVEEVIALYRQKRREASYIANPAGYFMQALKQGWASKNKNLLQDQSFGAEDKAALFNCWYDLAKELGYCAKWEIRQNDCGSSSVSERWVFFSGQWEKWTAVWERGFHLEYLRKVKKRFTNP